MDSIVAWVQAHPQIIAYTFSALVTWVFKPRSPAEATGMPVRRVALIHLVAAFTCDTPKATKAFTALVTGHWPADPPAPPPPSPPPPATKSDFPPDDPTPHETPQAKRLVTPVAKRVALLAALVASLSGCGLLAPAEPILTDINAIANDAQEVLNLVNTAAEAYFAGHPDLSTARSTYEAIYSRVHLALDGAIRALTGVQDLDQSKLDVAFADFKAAYNDLSQFLASFGITLPTGKYLAAPGAKPVAPVPMAFTAQAHK